MKITEHTPFEQTAITQKAPINVATVADETAAIDVIVRAFRNDPVVRWAWPDSQSYSANFSDFVGAFGGEAFSRESAYFVDGYAGAALWLPPNIRPGEEVLNNVLQCTVHKERQTDLFAMFEEMDRYHPREPHWYLPLIGIDPAQQGKGYGSALMQYALLQCDQDQTPAYLEASSVRSVPFYERHGFEVLGTIQEGTSPPLFPMLRKPQHV